MSKQVILAIRENVDNLRHDSDLKDCRKGIIAIEGILCVLTDFENRLKELEKKYDR